MNSNPCATAPLGSVIALQRPWLQRLLDALLARVHPGPRVLQDVDFAALADLNRHTLRDIGAPDWVQEERRRELLWELDRARW